MMNTDLLACSRRAVLLLISATCLSACGESQPIGTAISNVTVIDAENGVRENHTVIFDGELGLLETERVNGRLIRG